VLFIVTVKMSGSAGISRALAVLLSGPYSLTFWLGAVAVGLVLPLALAGGRRRTSAGLAALVAILVLVGGFVIKYVLIAAGQVT
jgi:protein NrfD